MRESLSQEELAARCETESITGGAARCETEFAKEEL